MKTKIAKKTIKVLVKHYGGNKETATALGITPRHWQNVRNGDHIGRFLAREIKRRALAIKAV